MGGAHAAMACGALGAYDRERVSRIAAAMAPEPRVDRVAGGRSARLDTTRPRRARMALFDALRRYGQAQLALDPKLQAPLLDRAHKQFETTTRRFEGHPSQNVLCTYATRSVRGVSRYPTGLLSESAVVTPGACDPVVRATLLATQAEKDDGRLYAAVFERLAPALGRLPSTTNTPRTGPRLPRRWLSAEAAAARRSAGAGGGERSVLLIPLARLTVAVGTVPPA